VLEDPGAGAARRGRARSSIGTGPDVDSGAECSLAGNRVLRPQADRVARAVEKTGKVDADGPIDSNPAVLSATNVTVACLVGRQRSEERTWPTCGLGLSCRR
jgi:hypothetical protein